DVLERIELAIGDGHQLDDTDRRMTGEARRLLEGAPAAIVGFDLRGEALHELPGPELREQGLDIGDTDVVDHGCTPDKDIDPVAAMLCERGAIMKAAA